MSDALNEVLSKKWAELRGVEIVSFGISSVKASEEDEQMIKELQKSAVMRDPNMAASVLAGAQADAMRDAAKNAGGAAVGFMGMNMAANTGGMDPASLYAMGAQQQAAAAAAVTPAAEGWTCSCGKTGNTGKFCGECGAPKPAEPESWTCGCGAVNTGRFCSECGQPKPAGAPKYKCAKCGWEPEDPSNPPKFCPQCGDPFDESDIV